MRSAAPSKAPASTVYHVDHAERLNPSDQEWNNIVQKNLANFKEEKERVIKDKREKSTRI